VPDNFCRRLPRRLARHFPLRLAPAGPPSPHAQHRARIPEAVRYWPANCQKKAHVYQVAVSGRDVYP